MSLNKMHPNLFFSVMICAIWAFTVGALIMICGEDVPLNYVFGGYFLLAGCLKFIGLKVSNKLWRFTMSITLGVVLLVGVGIIFQVWYMCSYVQGLMWLGFAALKVPIISEPPSNPVNVKP